jgi:hypothetical protein
VIGFALRLTLRGGREALLRLLVITGAVALGAGLLLTTLATLNAVNAQNARYAWLETGAGPSHPTTPGTTPIWWRLSADMFHGTQIGRVDVAATGTHSPLSPGLSRLPGPGEYFASPALATLIRSTPADELADRYPGHLAGEIGAAGLPAPGSLLVVVGHTPAQLAQQPGANLVDAISTTSPGSCSAACYDIGLNRRSIVLILSVVTAALLFPILVFVGTATRLAAARREQRFAAMRLVGATPRQIALISAVESTVAAAAGTLVGFGLFFAARPSLAGIPFTGAPFFVGDLSLSLLDVLLVALGVPIAAAVAARFALRRVIISPLGVTRRVTPAAPSAWRLLPLAAGLAELGYFVLAGRPATTGGQSLAFTTGVIVVMAGLVIAGPWLTMVCSRAMARRARRPAALLAARRLADDPRAGFRAISGLVLGLFVATVAVGIITSFVKANGGLLEYTAAQRSTLTENLASFQGHASSTPVQALPAGLEQELLATPGVAAVMTGHAGPGYGTPMVGPSGTVACTDLARFPAFGRCAPGATTALVDDFAGDLRNLPPFWPSGDADVASLASLPLTSIAIATDGSPATIERARTLLGNRLPSPERVGATTVAEGLALGANAKRTQGYQRLAEAVVLASLPIAGCTLAVSLVNGLNERKRPFSLLRLAGAPLGTLRRVVTLETAFPLLAGAAVAVAIGFLTAALFLRAQLEEPLVAPSIGYWAVVAAGLVASLAIVASTLPVLTRITGPATARND